MAALGIQHLGCHASKCANGAKPYAGFSEKQRADIQYRLIVDIVASKLAGAVSAIDMNAYRAVRERLAGCLAPSVRQYNEPHVLAVRQCVQHMCLMTEHVTNDPITFVVDRNDAFGRRASAWYSISHQKHDRHARRFGPFTEADRRAALGLQAADMLAYAGFRHVSGREGWQWRTLISGVEIDVFTRGIAFWQEVASEFDAGHANASGT